MCPPSNPSKTLTEKSCLKVCASSFGPDQSECNPFENNVEIGHTTVNSPSYDPESASNAATLLSSENSMLVDEPELICWTGWLGKESRGFANGGMMMKRWQKRWFSLCKVHVIDAFGDDCSLTLTVWCRLRIHFRDGPHGAQRCHELRTSTYCATFLKRAPQNPSRAKSSS